MFILKALAVSALTLSLGAGSAHAPAQIAVGVNVGAAPACPYGYFDYSPYNCAPYGYYGPDWFAGGLFIGAGPWYHGREGFYGHVDNRYDPRFGYHGPFPDRGAQPFQHFAPNTAIDAHGHAGNAGHAFGGEHSGGYVGGGHFSGGGRPR